MSNSTDIASCPFDDCAWTIEVPSKKVPITIRNHLSHMHNTPSELDSLSQETLTQYSLYRCSICKSLATTYVRRSYLESHMTKRHPSTRSLHNLTLIHSYFPPMPSTIPDEWESALTFLSNLTVEPPPFRYTWFHDMPTTVRPAVLATFGRLLDAGLDSLSPVSTDDTLPNSLTSPTPIWKLLTLFESLILAPTPKCSNLSREIHHRLDLLVAGHIPELYNNAYSLPSKLFPKETEETLVLDDDEDFMPNFSAQQAANLDNIHTALQRADASLPIAKNTDDTINHVKETLFPPRRHIDGISRAQTRRQAQTSHDDTYDCTLDDQGLLSAIRKMKRGTSNGPFADSTDLLICFALVHDKSSQHYPNLPTIRRFLSFVRGGHLPTSYLQTFTAQYYFGLHKDLQHLEKIRPILIGTGQRRFISSITAREYSGTFARYLFPYQFAFGIPSGMNLVIHSICALAESFVPGASPQSSATRVVLQLDLSAMYQNSPRDGIRHTLDSVPALKPLVPIYDTYYSTDNLCFYTQSDGTWNSFQQFEGHAQGCGLSGGFSAIGLHHILKQLDSILQARARSRSESNLPSDDGHGSETPIAAILDDVTMVPLLTDVSFIIREFRRIGVPWGALLNNTKSTVLATFNPNLPSNPIYDEIRSELSPTSILTNGSRLLGTPIGSNTFVREFLKNKNDDLKQSVDRLFRHIPNSQTLGLLYIQGIQARIPHLLFADVLANNTENSISSIVTPFYSPFINESRQLTAHFLSRIVKPGPPITVDMTPQWQIAHLNPANGGLGFRDFAYRAIPAFCVPLARSIRYATHGLSIQGENLALPPSLTSALSTWESSPLPLHQTFRTLAPFIVEHLNIPIDANPTSYLVDRVPFRTLQHDCTRYQNDYIRSNLLSDASPGLAAILPSLLIPHTAFPFHSVTRAVPDNRLSNQTYRLTICRRLRHPLLPDTLQNTHCKCGKLLDPYGDHFFADHQNHSKTKPHDKIRNILYVILETIAPLAHFTETRHDVLFEPKNTIPHHPGSRPADVALLLHPCYPAPKEPKFRMAAIDVSITSPCSPDSDADTNNHTESVSYRHRLTERRKFHGHDTRSSGRVTSGQFVIEECNNNNIVLIPFTVDPYGGLGFFARSFLFGPPSRQNMPLPDNYQCEPARVAYYNTISLHSPLGLLPMADNYWKEEHASHWFTATYHATTPSQWAQQQLGIHTLIAFGNHISASISRCQSRLLKEQPPPKHLPGEGSRFPPTISACAASPPSLKRSRTENDSDDSSVRRQRRRTTPLNSGVG